MFKLLNYSVHLEIIYLNFQNFFTSALETTHSTSLERLASFVQ